jgi:hypothetical protein
MWTLRLMGHVNVAPVDVRQRLARRVVNAVAAGRRKGPARLAAVHEIRTYQLPPVDLDEGRALLLKAESRLGIAAKLPPLREAACVAPPPAKRSKAPDA